ncbi:Uncharacterized membrane protein [Rhizobiales bacterium GAS191]|nr:Uncharacterized membrane protein [Rhizobiales bacterium GAS191]
MMTQLAFSPFIPGWALAASLGLALLLTLPFVLVRRRTAIWRALGFAALLLALANPRLVIENREKLRDTAVLVVDRTGSQTIAERPRQMQAARAEMQRRLAAIEGLDVRVVEVADGGKDEGTQLFRALSSAIGDLPRERIAGVIAITDGVVHDVPADAAALGFAGPLHALITGHPRERDRRIELVEAPRFGLVNKDAIIRARVVDPGFSDPVPLAVSVDGQRISSSEVRPGEVVSIPVPIAHAGRIVVEIDAGAAPDELTLRNNKAVVVIDGVRERLRVLLVSGAPHAGERVWRNLLKSDPSVDLVHFTILRPPEKSDGTPINELALIAFPQKELFEEKLHDFDLVIFDRFTNNITLPQRYFGNIADYVRGGGALLISAGPEFIGRTGLWNTQLESVLPAIPDGRIIETPYRPHVGIEGQRHPVTRDLPNWNSKDQPWGDWLRAIGARVRDGHVVLDGPDETALLDLARVGDGRVGLFLTDQLWLWPRGYEGGGPYLDLLRRMSHWLMKEPELDEEALRATADGHQVLVERQTLADSVTPVEITAPSGAASTLTLAKAEEGLWKGAFTAAEEGLYRLKQGDQTALVSAGAADSKEFQDVISDTERLRPIAEATGGSVRRIATNATGDIHLPAVVSVTRSSAASGADFIGLRSSDSYVVTGLSIWPLFLGFAGLALIGPLLMAAWFFEARGMGRKAGA